MSFFYRFLPALVVAGLLTGCGEAATEINKQAPAIEPYHPAPYHSLTQLKAPVGVRKIGTDEALRLHESGQALFIDVMGAIFREESLDFDGEWLLNEPRADIPGSVWLPNTGEEQLKPIIERYYRENLERLTIGDKKAALVFYCIEDCWMSWNASKRAAEWGYHSVLWYRKGVDGWKEAELPLEERFPVALPVD